MADILERPVLPKGPHLGHVIAVCLEIGIFTDVVRHHSAFGIVLCCAYAYFSATWAAFIDTKGGS